MRDAFARLMVVGFLVGGIVLAVPDDGNGQRRARRPDNAPKVGDDAPVFTLKALDGKSETNLAGFRDERPIVLFFGSYT